MPRIRLSFTEHRRRKLALKVSPLDRLEARSTVTPFAAFSLATGAFQTLAQLGTMQSVGNSPSAPLQPEAGAQGASNPSQAGRPQPGGTSRDILPIRILPTSKSAGGGGSGAPAVPQVAAPARAGSPVDDKLSAALAANSDPSTSSGITTPWKPAKPTGGGAAMAPRGGSGSGAQPAVSAMVLGHSPQPAAPTAPASPPTIPGLLTGGSSTGAASPIPAPVITRNAAAQNLNPGAGSTVGTRTGSLQGGSKPADSGAPDATGPTTVAENPSSLPSNTNPGGFAQQAESFPYFQLYTLDNDSGVVLYPGQYQQATLGGNVSLIAQVSGSTGPYTYSWTTSGSNFSVVTGTSTSNLQFTWLATTMLGATDSVTLTVTDANSHQES